MTFAWLNEQYYKCVLNKDWPVCLLLGADAHGEYIGQYKRVAGINSQRSGYPAEVQYDQYHGVPALMDNHLKGRSIRFILRGGGSHTFEVPTTPEGK